MKIRIVKGDIFAIPCDAYVNPTDVKLSGSGGLDRKIHERGGGGLERQCAALRGSMKRGEAAATSGGNLPVRYVLHAAAPCPQEETGESYELLKQCWQNILRAAGKHREIRRLAAPLVGTGTGGYSLSGPFYADSLCSRTAVAILSAIAEFPCRYPHMHMPEEIFLVCTSESKFLSMQDAFRWIFGKGLCKRERIRGALLGGAIGDALGYPVEFKGAGESWIQDYILDPDSGKALISDDTQMTLFTACGLLWGYSRSCMRGIGGDIWYYISVAYEDWLKTQDPNYKKRQWAVSWIRDLPELNVRRAPGNTCLSAIAAGCGSIQKPLNHSKGCGGVMRIAPIALYGAANRHWNQEYNARACAETAALTHGHTLGWLPAAALGNILFDIMQNFSLSYALEDTLLFLKKNYGTYAETEKLTGLLRRAENLAALDGYTSSINLMAEFSVTEALGTGWTGEEALALALFCVLATTGRGVEQCLWNAVGHEGDSDSVASIAGQIWGAYFGEKSLPPKWLRNLQLKDVIEEIADDLTGDCQMSEYGIYSDPAWIRKYLSGDQSTSIPGRGEAPPHVFLQMPWREAGLCAWTAGEKRTGTCGLTVENGQIFHAEKPAGRGKTKKGWVKVHPGHMAEVWYSSIFFHLLPNYGAGTVEILAETGPVPWIGRVRRRWDEWENPIEMEFVSEKAALDLQEIIGLLVMDRSFLGDFWDLYAG